MGTKVNWLNIRALKIKISRKRNSVRLIIGEGGSSGGDENALVQWLVAMGIWTVR